MHESEKSYFWQAKKVTKESRPELESFVNLVGGVSSGENALTDAGAVAERFRTRSAEFAAAVGELGRDETGSMVPLFKSGLVKQVMQEGSQVQMQALLGPDAEPETPLFPGGLVPSADGMCWLDPAKV
jgi:halogenation protein CepH